MKDTAPKKGKPMCYDCDCDEQQTVENRRLTFAQNRVNSISYDHDVNLEKMFHMNEDQRPQNGEELIARIKDGKYSLKDKDTMKSMWTIYGILDYFVWRDPSQKKDEEGYKLARKELEAAKDDAEVYVTLGDNKAAMEAIEEFLNWTPSNAPKSKK